MSDKMNIQEAYETLKAAYNARKEIIICLLGPPGIGKTSIVRQLAEEKGVNLVTIIASQTLPYEIAGSKMPNAEDKTFEDYDPSIFRQLKDGDILLFDEILTAPTAVLNACLTLLQERRLASGRPLPDVMIVAAANPKGSPANLDLAIRERFKFLTIEMDKGAWVNYMKKTYDIECGTLTSRLQDSGIDYNVLTPRSATKLLLWYKEAETEQDKAAIRRAMNVLYNPIISKSVADCIDVYSKTKISPDDLVSYIREHAISLAEDYGHGDCLVNDLKNAKDYRQLISIISTYSWGRDFLEELKNLREDQVQERIENGNN